MHKPVDAPVEKRKEHVQAAVRAHDQLHPHLPLRKLPDYRVLVAVPGS